MSISSGGRQKQISSDGRRATGAFWVEGGTASRGIHHNSFRKIVIFVTSSVAHAEAPRCT